MRALATSLLLLLLVTTALLLPLLAGQQFTLKNPQNQKWSSEDAQRIYQSACAVVAREFNLNHRELRPSFVLTLGADKDEALGGRSQAHELRLRKWDRMQFAEGMILLCQEELLPDSELVPLAARALAWADGTAVDINELKRERR